MLPASFQDTASGASTSSSTSSSNKADSIKVNDDESWGISVGMQLKNKRRLNVLLPLARGKSVLYSLATFLTRYQIHKSYLCHYCIPSPLSLPIAKSISWFIVRFVRKLVESYCAIYCFVSRSQSSIYLSRGSTFTNYCSMCIE